MNAIIWIHILGLFGTAVWMIWAYAKESADAKKEREANRK